MAPIPILSNDVSKPPIPSMLLNAALAEGLSKFIGGAVPGPLVPCWLLLVDIIMALAALAGDFLICCGEDLGPPPCGEKAAWRFE